jgi:hypothetical protein
VRLAAVQRVVRAQQVPGAGYLAHFSLFGLVTAGRDEGGYRFDSQAASEHLRWAARSLAAAGLTGIELAITPMSDAGERITAAVLGELAGLPVSVVTDRDRTTGRGYYRDVCFKVSAQAGGQQAEFGDGGLTDWTRRLTASNKERLLISGLGIDRLAHLSGAP